MRGPGEVRWAIGPIKLRLGFVLGFVLGVVLGVVLGLLVLDIVVGAAA